MTPLPYRLYTDLHFSGEFEKVTIMESKTKRCEICNTILSACNKYLVCFHHGVHPEGCHRIKEYSPPSMFQGHTNDGMVRAMMDYEGIEGWS